MALPARGHQTSPERASDKAPLHFQNEVNIIEANPTDTSYKSCAEANCAEKVNPTGKDKFFCSKCQTESKTFQWNLSLKLKVKDETDECWVTAFGEVS